MFDCRYPYTMLRYCSNKKKIKRNRCIFIVSLLFLVGGSLVHKRVFFEGILIRWENINRDKNYKIM